MIIAFREDHGDFPFSEDALKYLRLFPKGHEAQVHILHISIPPEPWLKR